jgi:hypothetical protein
MAGAEHSARLMEAFGEDEGTLAWHWLQAKVLAGPDTFGWADAGNAFAAYRAVFEARA